jgi:Ca-activated chloride channel homolog
MRTQSRILNLVAAVIAASVTVIAYAQEPQKQSPEKPGESAQYNSSWCKKKEDGSIECGSTTFLPAIKVSVTDSGNRPITGLGIEDFYIAEDDVKQEIEVWFHNDSSSSFSLAFDISDYEPLKLMARQVARNFVGQIRSTDEVIIPQLKADSQAVLGFAADKRSLENALVGIPSNDKLVGLVAEAIKSMEKGRHPMGGAVVVITDGHSLSGTASDRAAAYAILRQGVPIHFIILDDGHYMARSAAQSRVRQKRGLLTRLAAASGGLALVVKSEDEISAATEQIIHRLKSQYTIGYYPTNDRFDGSFRNIRVTAMPKDKRKVKVFAPTGYYAVGPEDIKEEKTNDK